MSIVRLLCINLQHDCLKRKEWYTNWPHNKMMCNQSVGIRHHAPKDGLYVCWMRYLVGLADVLQLTCCLYHKLQSPLFRVSGRRTISMLTEYTKLRASGLSMPCRALWACVTGPARPATASLVWLVWHCVFDTSKHPTLCHQSTPSTSLL